MGCVGQRHIWALLTILTDYTNRIIYCRAEAFSNISNLQRLPKYPSALRLQSQHNLSPRSVPAILYMKAAIKPQSTPTSQATALWYSPYNYQLLISKYYLGASTNGKTKKEICAYFDLLSVWFPLIFWRKTSLKTKQRERMREGYREEAHILKEPEGTR